jgi:Fe-S cluster assembly ATP-binding protein
LNKEELIIKDLELSINDKTIVEEISFNIKQGEVHVLMGPNGSGKSTIANAIMGNPEIKINKGSIKLNNEKINELEAEERAKKGIFMSFQNPIEIEGLSMLQFLRASYSAIKGETPLPKFIPILKEKIEGILPYEFVKRNLNTGFSGGEKKKSEILQMLLLEPKFVILDETDSGLDIDALKIIYNTIKKMNNTAFIIITHHINILKHITPDKVYIIKKGKIIKTGTSELIEEIENQGFESI